MRYFLKMLSLVYCLGPFMYMTREHKYKEDCKIRLFSIKLCLRNCIWFYHLLCLVGGRLHVRGLECKNFVVKIRHSWLFNNVISIHGAQHRKIMHKRREQLKVIWLQSLKGWSLYLAVISCPLKTSFLL